MHRRKSFVAFERKLVMPALTDARNQLAIQDYAIVPADALLSAAERATIDAAVFGADMEHDYPNVHPNRDRLDDVVCFEWRDEAVHLSEARPSGSDASRINISLTKNFAQRRDYRRMFCLDVPPLAALVEQVLLMIPESARRPRGQVGVHAVRTYGTVVANWHRDGSELSPVDWVISYVVSRNCAGGLSSLAVEKGGPPTVSVELGPGQLLIHRDLSYYHYVTPIMATPEHENPQRCAIVMMVRPRLEGY